MYKIQIGKVTNKLANATVKFFSTVGSIFLIQTIFTQPLAQFHFSNFTKIFHKFYFTSLLISRKPVNVLAKTLNFTKSLASNATEAVSDFLTVGKGLKMYFKFWGKRG